MNDPQLADFIADLRSRNEAVRGAAIEALGKIGLPAVPALIATFKSRQYDYQWYRMNFGKALAKMQEPAVPALINALLDDDTVANRPPHRGRQPVNLKPYTPFLSFA